MKELNGLIFFKLQYKRINILQYSSFPYQNNIEFFERDDYNGLPERADAYVSGYLRINWFFIDRLPTPVAPEMTSQ